MKRPDLDPEEVYRRSFRPSAPEWLRSKTIKETPQGEAEEEKESARTKTNGTDRVHAFWEN